MYMILIKIYIRGQKIFVIIITITNIINYHLIVSFNIQIKNSMICFINMKIYNRIREDDYNSN